MEELQLWTRKDRIAPFGRTSAPVRGGHDPRDDQAGGLACGKEKTGKA